MREAIEALIVFVVMLGSYFGTVWLTARAVVSIERAD